MENKIILKIGHRQFIMKAEAGISLFKMLSETGLEVFDPEWNKETKTTEPRVKMVGPDDITLCMLTPEQYAMGKLLQKSSTLT